VNPSMNPSPVERRGPSARARGSAALLFEDAVVPSHKTLQPGPGGGANRAESRP
jgi:hypothetical protein